MILKRSFLYVLILFANSDGDLDISSNTDVNDSVSDHPNIAGHDEVPARFGGFGDIYWRSDIQRLLEGEEAQDFLQLFNQTQQTIIHEYLLNCPYNKLCRFNLDLKIYDLNEEPCCVDCLCNYPDCMRNRSCCPDILPPELFTVLETDDANNDPQPDPENSTSSDVVTSNTKTNFAKTTVQRIADIYKRYHIVQPGCTLEHAKLMPKAPIDQTSSRMFAVCPPLTEEPVKAKCEQKYTFDNIDGVDDMVPITVDGHTYRNKYCIECFEIPLDMNARYWKVKLTNIYKTHPIATSDESVFLKDFFSREDFDLQFVDPYSSSTPETCTTVVSECDKTGLWVKYDSTLVTKCALYANPIRLYSNSRIFYQNVYCALCNGENVSTATTCPQVFSAPADSYPFSGLLAFSPSHTDVNRAPALPVSNQCKRGDQVYDTIKARCVSVQCSKFHYLTDSECQRLFSEVDAGFFYHIRLLLTPTSNVKLMDVFPNMSQLQNVLFRLIDSSDFNEFVQMCYSLTYFTLKESYTRIADVDIFESPLQHVHFLYRYSVDQIHNPYIIADIYSDWNGGMAEIQTAEGTISFIVTAIEEFDPPFPLTDFSVDLESLFRVDFRFSWQAVMSKLSSKSKPDSNKRIIIPYETRIYTDFCPDGSEKHSSSFVSITDCPVVTLTKDETNWQVFNNGNVKVNDYDFTFEVGDFYFQTTTTLQVCLYAYFDMVKSTRNEVISVIVSDVTLERILSIACVAISIICLIITVGVFVSLPSIRTLPGMNTLALSTSLLFAQSLYLVSSFGRLEKKSLSCIMVGLLLHFFSLLSIFWMNICTFNMFRVLTRTKVASTEFGRKYALFHLFAALLSITLVAVCVTVSLYLSGGSDLGYGSSKCYFSSVVMLRFTFVLPVFVVVISNFFMFIVVIFKFERSPKYIRSASNRNEFLIFIKLSSLTGVTWIFGVLYSWFDTVIVLSYIFIILNASQGMFIMISFVFNGRVLRMSRDKFRSSWLGSFHNSSVTKHAYLSATSNTDQSPRSKSEPKYDVGVCHGGGKLSSEEGNRDKLDTNKPQGRIEDSDTCLGNSGEHNRPQESQGDTGDTVAKVDDVDIEIKNDGACVKDIHVDKLL